MNGKMWRLLKNRYEGGCGQVKLVVGYLIVFPPVYRGVRQGSVLSPTLFFLVMDPHLKDIQMSGIGLSINSFYARGFLHQCPCR